MASVLICDLWENIPVPHAPFQIQHSTSNIPQSQHSSPKSTRFFPSRPAPRPNTPFSACHCNHLTFSHLPFEPSPRHLPPTPSHTTKRHLSTLDPCPFEAPSLTFRLSIPKPPQPETCPTPTPPLAYGHSARSIPPPKPPNRAFPPSVSPKIPTQDLRQIFLM